MLFVLATLEMYEWNILDEWLTPSGNTRQAIPHSAVAVRVCAHMTQFFVDEARKSTHSFEPSDLQDKVVVSVCVCMPRKRSGFWLCVSVFLFLFIFYFVFVVTSSIVPCTRAADGRIGQHAHMHEGAPACPAVFALLLLV